MKHSSHALTETHRVIRTEIPQSEYPLPPPRNASLARNFMNECQTSLHTPSSLLNKQTFGMSAHFISVLSGEKIPQMLKDVEFAILVLRSIWFHKWSGFLFDSQERWE
ncbi:hypothetical protein CEXT_551601 [Caerostris extrusa]|uniref:Uncharacterized protein n=1 Tax=Caerostris extrusa TaxID=172846 RepID=A0AAV4SVZ6_CAEEX|nr:hypothetical protein CEXT_551601 [Caerostris extrusa]